MFENLCYSCAKTNVHSVICLAPLYCGFCFSNSNMGESVSERDQLRFGILSVHQSEYIMLLKSMNDFHHHEKYQ